jgi:phosphoserine phosphatase
MEPERNSYTLYAYGDSRGDKEMLEFADFPTFVH